tara:strand:- start:160 stop:774 length:615 start_codon:yes stop_codon:yes gene_type:complete
MPVEIHGKEYSTVAERVNSFRESEKYTDFCIETEILTNNETVVLIRCVVKNADGRIMATGHAEEVRNSTKINKTSALENCETSAIGRALASMNFGGEQFASANEVSDTIIQQHVIDEREKFIKQTNAINANLDTIGAVKQYLYNQQYSLAAEAMAELSEDAKQALNIASTKGGIWTLEETKLFKSEEYQQARTAFYTNSEKVEK